MTVQRVAGSFRDPSGFVFTHDNDIFRSIDDSCHEILKSLANAGKLADLIQQELIVGTEFLGQSPLLEQFRTELPDSAHFLKHQRVEQISYPYEWTVSMLADAGVHTLDLQIELLESGFSLKDATPYNIQFVDGKPTMIDVASIERPERLDVWIGLGQFLQMFVYPLFLCRYRGWDLRSYFLSNLNGRKIDDVAKSFGWMERLRPSLLLDLTIPWWFHRHQERKASDGQTPKSLEKKETKADAQILNLKRLRKKLGKLASGYKTSGIWAEYTQICNYESEADQAKQDTVRNFLKQTSPETVLDIGCNTGQYSYLAASCGANVTAVDGDHDAIENLYRRLRDEPASINPMVVDLANPSPAIGYMNVERESFLDRSKPDCVMALALIHHLWVSANMSTEAICEFLYLLTNRDLILEFVPTDDNMFVRLMNYRVDLFQHIDLQHVIETFSQKFDLQEQKDIAGSKRTMLLFTKK